MADDHKPTMQELVELITQRVFHGDLPDCPQEIAAAIFSTCLRDQPFEVVDHFLAELLPALERQIDQQHRSLN